MPTSAHVEYFGGPLDGKQATLSRLPEQHEVAIDGVTHQYAVRCVPGNVPMRLPDGRYAMDYVGVTETNEE